MASQLNGLDSLIKKKNHFEMKKYQHFSRIIETADYQKLFSLIRNVRISVTFHFDYYSMHLNCKLMGFGGIDWKEKGDQPD